MLRAAALRVTRPRVAVLTAVHDHPHADTDSIIGVVREDLGEVSHQAVYDVLRALTAAGLVRRIAAGGLRGALRGAGRGQPPPRRLPVVRRHRRRRLRGRRHPLPDRRPTTRATRSTKPRSSTGADAPSVSRRLLPRPAADRRTEARRHGRQSRSLDPEQPPPRAMSHQQRDRRRTDVSDKKDATASVSESENPVIPAPTPKATRPRTNRDWWPNQLDLSVLHQHSPLSNPMGEDFNYAEEFKTLDVDALKRDLIEVMTTSQDWWPADYGHYGPLFIRMTWHAAGTYRIADGRGGGGSGAQRFAPLNSWPDNANLDKARRLLWPIKQKYGRKISWADLLVFAGNVRLGIDGVQDVRLRLRARGHLGARGDLLGPRGHLARRRALQRRPGARRPARRRADGPDLRESGGPQRQPGSAGFRPGHPRDLRPHGDERRGDGRAHHRRPHVRQDPRRGRPRARRPGARGRAPSSSRASAGRTAYGSGKGADTITSGLEGAWTNEPTKWDNGFLDNLFKYDWELTTSPAGAKQWTPKDPAAQGTVPDAHDPSKRHAPMMLTTDLALRIDPIYGPIAKRFHENPDQLADAFAKAWYKLLHRDMGPVSRYLGPWVPEPQLWQDPVPAVDHELIGDADIAALKAQDPRLGTVHLPAGLHRLGVGGQLPRHRQARRGQRGADPPRAAEGLGGQRPGRAGQGAADPRADPAGLQQLTVRRQEGLARRPDRPGRVRGRRAGGEERRARHHGPVRAGAHGRLAGADRRGVVRRARTDRRRVPQLPPSRREAVAGDPAAGPGLHVDADRSRDDGAGRRHAGPERQLRAVRSTASSPTGPRR